MATLEELDTLLAGDYSPDYWSDDVVLTARDMIDYLSPLDWTRLRTIWRSRPQRWQHRLADCLSRESQGKAVPILTEMIEEDDDELAMTAADSLSATDAHVPSSSLTPKALTKLRELAKHDPVNKLTVDQLMRKLSAQPVRG